MTSARVWGWGEDFELARDNSEKYVSKRWKKTTKECSVIISGKEIDEGTEFSISAYTSEPKKAGDLAEDLLDIVLSGNNKPYFITIDLYDYLASDEEVYRDSLQVAEEAYKGREQLIIQKFKDHPKVKALSQGEKPIVVFPLTTVLCEMQSDNINKIIV